MGVDLAARFVRYEEQDGEMGLIVQVDTGDCCYFDETWVSLGSVGEDERHNPGEVITISVDEDVAACLTGRSLEDEEYETGGEADEDEDGSDKEDSDEDPSDTDDYAACDWCQGTIKSGNAIVSVVKQVAQVDITEEYPGGIVTVIDSDELLTLCANCGNRFSVGLLREDLKSRKFSTK